MAAITPEMAYGASNAYTEQTVIGMGALKGAPAQIQSISDNLDGTHTVTFLYEDTLGERHTMPLTVRDGERGEQGAKGDQGDEGFSPVITVLENTEYVYKLKIRTKEGEFITPNLKGAGTATGDYDDLIDKPKINGVELSGDMSSDDLKIKGAEYTVTGETLVIK